MNIPQGKIEFSFIPKLSEYYNNKFNKEYGYQLINDAFEFIYFQKQEQYIKILLRDEHYFVFDYINYNNVTNAVENY